MDVNEAFQAPGELVCCVRRFREDFQIFHANRVLFFTQNINSSSVDLLLDMCKLVRFFLRPLCKRHR